MIRTLYGGSGHGDYEVGIVYCNNTMVELEIHYRYSTVANGTASRIAAKPGECFMKYSSGSMYEFSTWRIGSRSDFDGYPIYDVRSWSYGA